MSFGFKIIFAAAGMILLSGCASGFLAASVSPGAEGGVYRVRQDRVRLLANLPTLNYLIHDPDTDYYYGTLNRDPASKERSGAAAVLKKSAADSFSVIQIVNAGGRTPCFLSLSPDRHFLYTANYSSGDISEFPLKNGLISGRPRMIRHSGQSLTRRQRSPHPHFAAFGPDGKQLYVCDLGTDRIWIYDWHPEKGLILPCAEKLSLPPGSGPRHLAFDPSGNVLYCANELNSTAASFIRAGTKWSIGAVRSTLKDPAGTSRNFPGAIKITGDGRYFFVSNRGHDSIALFRTDGKGDFSLLDTIPSGGVFPSDLQLDRLETELRAVHLKDGGVKVFSFDRKNGTLTPLSGISKVPQGICLCEE